MAIPKKVDRPLVRKRRRETRSVASTSDDVEFERVIQDDKHDGQDSDNDRPPTVMDNESQPISLRILNVVKRIRRTQFDDFESLHTYKC